MRELFRGANPGLARRFQLDEAFRFPDFDDAALVRILRARARRDGLAVDLPLAKRAVASLAGARARPHFGNAGAVETLLSAAKLRFQRRTSGHEDAMTAEDFGVERAGPDDAALDTLFDDLIDCGEVRAKLEALRSMALFARSRGDDPRELVCFNYLFVGPPGTGKTTVARRMGRMFRALGLLPDDTVHEISASELITGYVGQASPPGPLAAWRARTAQNMSRFGRRRMEACRRS